MKKVDYIRRILIIMSGTGLLGYLIVSSWFLSGAPYKNISRDQLFVMMNYKDFILINVHVPYEGEIPGTDLFIPFNAIEKLKNELPNDKNIKIMVYCMSGYMSRIAAEKLTGMGYTQVLNFQDGMRDWKEAGGQILYKSG